MKTPFTLLSVLLTLTTLPAFAQTEADPTGDDYGVPFALAPGVNLNKLDYMAGYKPTQVTSEDELNLIMRSERKAKPVGSQCYNRASVWTYEATHSYEKRFSEPLNMVKIFIFYTETFRQRNHFDWWFHVAPAVMTAPFTDSRHMNLNDLMVIDKIAYNHAVPFRDWTDYFHGMQGSTRNSECKQIFSYYEYTQNQNNPNEDCYHLIVPMYYWRPMDLSAVEKLGKPMKTLNWNESDLTEAYSQAFRERF